MCRTLYDIRILAIHLFLAEHVAVLAALTDFAAAVPRIPSRLRPLNCRRLTHEASFARTDIVADQDRKPRKAPTEKHYTSLTKYAGG